MEDISLRLEFHRALDAVATPAPWLASRVREDLRRRGVMGVAVERAPWRTLKRTPAWLLPAVAALLAVAIVVAIVVGTNALHPRAIPVKPPQVHGPAGITCPTWAPLASLKNGPIPTKMASPSIGWAAGGLRTTDGAHMWHDVSPTSFRADIADASQLYPPGYTDFFLDATNAWLARPYVSSTSCFDHIAVFITGDGGRTWHQSSPIVVALQGDSQLQMQLSFIDFQHGWLLVQGGGRLLPDDLLLGTADGGHTWHLLSQLPSATSMCALQFSSLITGWLGACGDFSGGGPSLQLTVTHDGGSTWTVQDLPAPPGGCTCSPPIRLTFVDSSAGAFLVDAYKGNFLYFTTDGGATWRVVSALPGSNLFPGAFDLADALHLWALVPDPTWRGKGAPTWLYESSDEGVHWKLVQENVPINLPGASLQFVDPMHGWAVQTNPNGQGSQVFATSDGGHTWAVVNGEVS